MDKNIETVLEELKRFQGTISKAIDDHKEYIKWCEENLDVVTNPNDLSYLAICKKILELLELEKSLTSRMIQLDWESDLATQQFFMLKESLINTINAKDMYERMGNDIGIKEDIERERV